jgi:hypothetical protein
MWTASALCTLLLEHFWTKDGLKLLLRVSGNILLVSVEYPFHFGRKSYDLDIQNCKGPLSTAILNLSGSCPKNAIASDFSVDISIPKRFALFCSVNTAVCKSSCEGAQTNVQNVHLLVQALFRD